MKSQSIARTAALVLALAAGTVLAGWQPAGGGSVEWDGEGDCGQDAGSGVFFARMTAGDAAEAIPLVRVR